MTRRVTVNLAGVIGIMGFLFWIVNSHMSMTENNHLQQQIHDDKHSAIVSNINGNKVIDTPQARIDKYPDLTDFIFSIQDFRQYNPINYDKFMVHVGNFLRLQEENNINIDGRKYGLSVNQKQQAINALHSMVYSLPTDIGLFDKFNRSIERLNELLTKHLKVLQKKHEDNIKEHGLTINSVLIPEGPKSFNYYDITNHTYDVPLV